MPHNTLTHPRFKKTLLALAAVAVLAPHGAWALDLAQSPPGTVEPYVTPNVIISIDDSGSMNYRVDQENATGATNNAIPTGPNNTWLATDRRTNVLKYALIGNNGIGGVFRDTSLLPDKKIRLAWLTMNGSPKTLYSNSTATTLTNSMKVLDSTHRTNFINFVTSVGANGGTPAHQVFQQADAYMRLDKNQNGPWASVPGTTAAPYLGCRRNYHIFMTDGGWNKNTDIAIPDNTRRDNALNLKLADDAVYGGTTAADQAKTALYRDTDPKSTLADWAFYSWATPLQTIDMTGTMQAATDYRKAPATENFGPDTSTPPKNAILDRYWNPRYNPATWAHMVTYTIGFGATATLWPNVAITGATTKVPYGYDGSFPDLVTGKKSWPSNMTSLSDSAHPLDLWHAAINGRGRFYAVAQAADLEKAFRDIFVQINSQTDPDLTSTATSGSNTSRNDVGKFTGAYEPKNAWKGFVSAETVQKDGTTVSASGWNGKNTADKLDALSSVTNRLILSWSDQWSSTKYKGGVPFKWASDETNLNTAQKASLGLSSTTPPSTSGEKRLDFIRGDKILEGSETTGYTVANPFRERKSRQGDIINSVVWYAGAPASNYPFKGYAGFTRENKSRPAMIYVGGNDGMLHGFSASDGSERIAYVPRGVISSLRLLTDPTYNQKHKYFVDGSPMTGDVDTSEQDPDAPEYSPSWRTLLMGTLGTGGKGYFVLDVTNPTASDTTIGLASIAGFTESNAQQLAKLDRTRGSSEAAPNCALIGMSAAEKTACDKAVDEDKDIGHITARPVLDEANPMRTTQITRMNNNRWAAVLGNGYNSENQRSVLLVQYLDGDQKLLRIPVTVEVAGTGKAKDSGLSAPRLVDLNGDGRTDVAYAGDNLGNMWKFDLTNLSDANWGVAFSGQPLFTAKGPTALNSSTRPNIQPVTVAPTVRANDRSACEVVDGKCKVDTSYTIGGMMVAFGTGRNVANNDAESVQVQTLYSVLDNTRYRVNSTTKRLEVHPGKVCSGPPTSPPCVPAPTPKQLGEGVVEAKLAKQTITELSGGDFATVDVNAELKKETWVNYNGWYLDLPSVGERLLKPMEFYDGSNILAIYSQVPAKGSNVDPNVESCESSSVDEERQYRTLINIMDGKRPTVQIVDTNGDGVYNASDLNVSRVKVSKGSHNLITQKDKILDMDAKNNKNAPGGINARMPEQSLRPSWRQLR